MKLQTPVRIPEGEPKIGYDSKVFLLGSCFSENIGDKFQYYKFQSLQNPFGILFHPFVIEQFLERLVSEKFYTKEDLVYHNKHWHCFEAHSKLSAGSCEEILTNLNMAVQETRHFLTEASHVILTYGTAWVYRFISTDQYVANCHKIPPQKFQKEIISADRIQQSIEKSICLLRKINSSIKLIFTVSPVRHAKDGLVENSRSKANLLSAIHLGIEKNLEQNSYFPSYELMMDELRDYRFYKDDLLHPSAMAIDYIWEKFSASWLEAQSFETMKQVAKIQRGLQHKAFYPESEAYQKFLKKLASDKSELAQKWSHITF